MRLSLLLSAITVTSQTVRALKSEQNATFTTTPAPSLSLLEEQGRQLSPQLTPSASAPSAEARTHGGDNAVHPSVQAQKNGYSQGRDEETNSTGFLERGLHSLSSKAVETAAMQSRRSPSTVAATAHDDPTNRESPGQFGFCEAQHSPLSGGVPSATLPTALASLSSSVALPIEFVFVLHRHGARSASSYASSTPLYGGVQPGQLLLLGAKQLRESGLELRRHLLSSLMKTLGGSESREIRYPQTRIGPTSFPSPAPSSNSEEAQPGEEPGVAEELVGSSGSKRPEAKEVTGEDVLHGMSADSPPDLSSINQHPKVTSESLDSFDTLLCLYEAEMVTDCAPQTGGLSALLELFPTSSMLVRASAYPRTKWSALAFLEGFYGLPRGCLVSPDDLLRTEGKKSGETWCVTRKVCTEVAGAHLPEPTSSGVTRLPGNALTVAHAFTHADKQCVDFQLPCVTAAPAASDGLARGVISSDAPATVWKLFGEIKAKPLWIKKAAELDQVLRTAAEVFGEKAVGELGWMIGDTLVCEEAAGEEVPLKKLHEWFESHDPEKGHLQRRGTAEAEAGEHPAERAPSKNSTRVSLSTSGSATHLTGASEADGRFGVHTYLGAIGDIREAFRAGFDLVYADEKLGKYIAQGPVRLLNAFFRTKAYGRQTDVEELRRIAAEVGGFETFLHPELAVSTGEKKSESGGEPQFSSGSGGDEKFLQAVQDVMVMLLSLHDHCLVGFLATLGVYDHAIVPPGARVYVELVRIDKPFKAARGRTHDAGSSSRQETPFVRGRGRDTIPQKVSDGGVRDGNTNRGQQPDTRIDDEGATTSVSLGSTESNRELPTFEGAYTEHRRDWPPSGFFVRLSYGGPERSMQEIALPFCAEKMSPDDTRLENLCPLDVWLTWTYEELDR